MIPRSPSSRRRPRAFALVEVLVSVAILTIVTGITYGVFAAVSKAWQRGTVLSEDLHHGDFVIEQLVMALRSAYYRDTSCGLILEDNGGGDGASDTISWVKLGASLVGEEAEVAKGPHRIQFMIDHNPETGNPGAAITYWSPDAYLQPEEFDPARIPPLFLSERIVGFNCRVATNVSAGTIEWEDTWDKTNDLPPLLELTLYLQPLEDGEPPVEMKRCVSIPVKGPTWK